MIAGVTAAWYKYCNTTGSQKPYAINLMWINRELDTKQHYLVPEDKQALFFEACLSWSKKNPKASTIIWFDSATTTKNALEKTKQRIIDLKTGLTQAT